MNDDQLSELLRRLEHEWAPEVLALAARIVFWDAVGWLMVGAICAIVASVCAWHARRLWVQYADATDDVDVPTSLWLFLILGVVLTSAIASFTLLDIWNWIALFDPQLAVAKRVLDMLTRAKS